MKTINKVVEISAQTTTSVFKRNLTSFAAVLLAALAGLVASPNGALAAAPQHHDQQPGFYRLKVGDLEVTALYDGTGVFDPHWLTGRRRRWMVLSRDCRKIRTCWMLLIAASWSTPASN